MGSSSLPHRGQSFHLSQSGAFLPDMLLVVCLVPTYLHGGIIANSGDERQDPLRCTGEVPRLFPKACENLILKEILKRTRAAKACTTKVRDSPLRGYKDQESAGRSYSPS